MWQKKRSSIFFVVIYLILIIYLGFLRDSIFININYILDSLYFNTEVVYYHSMYSFLVPMGVGGLVKLKWGLTIVFMLVNYLLSFGILRNLFIETKNSLSLLTWGYVGLFIISALLMLGAKLVGQSELGYTLARRFMGVLQSPVPLMVVVAVHLLFGSRAT